VIPVLVSQKDVRDRVFGVAGEKREDSVGISGVYEKAVFLFGAVDEVGVVVFVEGNWDDAEGA